MWELEMESLGEMSCLCWMMYALGFVRVHARADVLWTGCVYVPRSSFDQLLGCVFSRHAGRVDGM